MQYSMSVVCKTITDLLKMGDPYINCFSKHHWGNCKGTVCNKQHCIYPEHWCRKHTTFTVAIKCGSPTVFISWAALSALPTKTLSQKHCLGSLVFEPQSWADRSVLACPLVLTDSHPSSGQQKDKWEKSASSTANSKRCPPNFHTHLVTCQTNKWPKEMPDDLCYSYCCLSDILWYALCPYTLLSGKAHTTNPCLVILADLWRKEFPLASSGEALSAQ